MARIICIILFSLVIESALAQMPGRGNSNLLQNLPGGGLMNGGFGNSNSASGPFKDSLLHRTGLEDSATISFRYLDTARYYVLDSSVGDFSRRWPVPWTSVFLGNTGSASRSLLFKPNLSAGWDAGFHAFDPYMLRMSDVRFFQTTRPYTQLNYILGSKAEQTISLLHTQNIRPNWNFSLHYNLINAPGIFRNQKNHHNNYLANTWYTSTNKRYAIYFAAIRNTIGATENGGLKNVSLLDSTPTFSDRFNIPTNFGGTAFQQQSFLNNTITTGNRYSNSHYLLRQSYDFGKKDSVVLDSTTIHYFYPRFRVQHTIQYAKSRYEFLDLRVVDESYKSFYGVENPGDTFQLKDQWRFWDNEISVYQFPDLKNQQQYIKAAAGIQNVFGSFDDRTLNFQNVYIKGEYRNRTRNKKWDMELAGTLYTVGFHAGDYNVQASLKSMLSKKAGLLTLSFLNVNRTPSFVHDDRSSFKRFNIGNTNFQKENTTVVGVLYDVPLLRLRLGGSYTLVSNYTYFRNYTQSVQEATLLNFVQLQLSKIVRLSKRWNWYSEWYLQKTSGQAPVHVPLLLTRQRIAYEGSFFKNLNLSAGLELRYHSNYRADGYSPLLGQFFLQDSVTIRNRPDLTAYVHVRIRSMYLFLRGENLNSVQTSPSFGFLRNNLVTPLQPLPGLVMRFGIFWGFVN
jgi:hypothetical protein